MRAGVGGLLDPLSVAPDPPSDTGVLFSLIFSLRPSLVVRLVGLDVFLDSSFRTLAIFSLRLSLGVRLVGLGVACFLDPSFRTLVTAFGSLTAVTFGEPPLRLIFSFSASEASDLSVLSVCTEGATVQTGGARGGPSFDFLLSETDLSFLGNHPLAFSPSKESLETMLDLSSFLITLVAAELSAAMSPLLLPPALATLLWSLASLLGVLRSPSLVLILCGAEPGCLVGLGRTGLMSPEAACSQNAKISPCAGLGGGGAMRGPSEPSDANAVEGSDTGAWELGVDTPTGRAACDATPASAWAPCLAVASRAALSSDASGADLTSTPSGIGFKCTMGS